MFKWLLKFWGTPLPKERDCIVSVWFDPSSNYEKRAVLVCSDGTIVENVKIFDDTGFTTKEQALRRAQLGARLNKTEG